MGEGANKDKKKDEWFLFSEVCSLIANYYHIQLARGLYRPLMTCRPVRRARGVQRGARAPPFKFYLDQMWPDL